MLLKGKILLAALGAASAAAGGIDEIPEGKVASADGDKGGEHRELYGPQPGYPGAQKYIPYHVTNGKYYSSTGLYNEKYIDKKEEDDYSSESADYSADPDDVYSEDTDGYDESSGDYVEDSTTGYKAKQYTDDKGTYVYRKRNGQQFKVYVGEDGWNTRGRNYNRTGARKRVNGGRRKRTAGNRPRNKWRNGGRKKPADWSPPAPSPASWSADSTPSASWSTASGDSWSTGSTWSTPKPTAWKPPGWANGNNVQTYSGNYDFAYRNKPTYGGKPTYYTSEPTMVPTWSDIELGRKCDDPFYSTCCNQKDHYTLPQKENLCTLLGCDYDDCYDDDKTDDWKSDAWKSSGDTWASSGDNWSSPTHMPTWGSADKPSDECTLDRRKACCTQTAGDEATKIEMCDRLHCDYHKCEKPTAKPSVSPTISSKPTWDADGWGGDGNVDAWEDDGTCSKDDQNLCCTQHESKSLETQAKICQNKWGCSVFKCPWARKGQDGWFNDAYDGLDWDGDGNDTCDKDEQAKCCSQHDGISITKQQQTCKNMWNCSLLKCAHHRINAYDDGHYEDSTCSSDDKFNCCNQHPAIPFGDQYGLCTKLGCNLHDCDDYKDGAWEDDGYFPEDKGRCLPFEREECCSQSSKLSLGAQQQNCAKSGCNLLNCPGEVQGGSDDNDYYTNAKPQFMYGYGGDDSQCPDGHKWQCCSQNLKAEGGNRKEVFKTCKQLGCEYEMCPKFRDDTSDYDSYPSSSYEYGDSSGAYSDKCTDAGKWQCCNPTKGDLLGTKAWVKNCEELGCSWDQCPHHRKGYYDTNLYDPSYKKKSPTSAPTLKYEDTCKNQAKCCNQKGLTLKQAAKSCMHMGCDIAQCNTHYDDKIDYDGYDSYDDNGYPSKTGYGNKGPKLADDSGMLTDEMVQATNGGGDMNIRTGAGNTGPRPNAGGEGGGNTGPRPDAGGNGGGGNTGPRTDSGSVENAAGDSESFTSSGSGTLTDPLVEKKCTQSTRFGRCTETCIVTSSYKIGGVTMGSHERTETGSC